MSARGGKSWLMLVIVMVIGYSIIVPVSGYIERSRPSFPEGYEDSDLMIPGSKLKGYALGTEGLIADWYWMRSLQYIGDKILAERSEMVNLDDLRSLNPRLLYPYLENATELDPHFTAAYAYGALVLPAIDPQKAIQITRKGIENNPSEWRLYQYLGYIYWKLGQYDKASEAYESGSRISGAAPFMRLMAAAMKDQGGSRGTARSIYSEMLQSSDDEQVKSTAQRRLADLDRLDQREAIDKELASHKERTGRCPLNLSEIVPALMGVKLPGNNEFSVDRANRLVDPTGVPYVIEPGTCRVVVSDQSTSRQK